MLPGVASTKEAEGCSCLFTRSGDGFERADADVPVTRQINRGDNAQ